MADPCAPFCRAILPLLLLSSAAAFSISPSPRTPAPQLALHSAGLPRSKCSSSLAALREGSARSSCLHRLHGPALFQRCQPHGAGNRKGAMLRMTQAKQDESSFGFFKNLAKRQGLSMGGCAVGLLVGLFLAYQVLSLLVWLVSKVLGFGAVMVCSRYPLGFCYWVVPKWVKPAIALFLLVTGVAPLIASLPGAISGAECPVYTIEKQSLGGVSGVDLRRYEAFPVAQMDTAGSTARERMQNAFGRLTGYVTSMNKDPQTGRKVNLGISGFLMIRKDGSGQPFVASLALPGKDSRRVYPTPLDSAITVGTMESTLYAGTTLEGGLPDDSVLEELLDAVQDAAEAEGLRMKASVAICQVMGEFKTEVLVPVVDEGRTAAPVDVKAATVDDAKDVKAAPVDDAKNVEGTATPAVDTKDAKATPVEGTKDVKATPADDTKN